MLEISQISRCYGSFKAVEDISFAIKQGQIVGLLGHNGAGKTTIMKMISGSLEPDQGEVHIDGIDLVAEPAKAQAKLGYLSENLPTYPEMIVADYLDYCAQIKGIAEDVRFEEMRRVIAATDIHDKIHARIDTLSRGYRQRVGVAQALLGHPRLLILDEPTNGLDPTQTAQMRALITEAAKEATVILSTHIMQEVDAICDRVLILSAGRLVVDELLSDLQYSNELLLSTSMDATTAKEKLRPQEGVTGLVQITRAADSQLDVTIQTYRVNVAESADLHAVGANLARAVVAAEESVYRLEPVERDLETVFRSVSSGETVMKGDN